MRGRKPRATEVNEANGSYDKNPSRRPQNMIKADVRVPSAPEIVLIDPVALGVWTQTVDVLKDCNILSKTDEHLLTTYCVTYAEWLKVAKRIARDGHEDANGKTSPDSVAFFKLSAQHSKLMAELGLTPSARTRLATTKPEEKADQGASLASIISALKG